MGEREGFLDISCISDYSHIMLYIILNCISRMVQVQRSKSPSRRNFVNTTVFSHFWISLTFDRLITLILNRKRELFENFLYVFYNAPFLKLFFKNWISCTLKEQNDFIPRCKKTNSNKKESLSRYIQHYIVSLINSSQEHNNMVLIINF